MTTATLSSPSLAAPPAPPPLALYVHIPWCVRKCPYCDFNSHAARGEVPEADYLDALERDLIAALPQVWGREVGTIFIGGGTPSLFTDAGIDHLLTMVRTLLPVYPLAEITLEANPGTFEVERFKGFRAAGVNRLSLGVQSFNPRHLQALGRIHDDREARAAVEAALSIFDNVNLDLMYALPGQTLEEAARDLETALACGPTHLSSYHLTLEPNTAFAAAPPDLPDDDLSADMQAMVEAKLAEAGYEHYETSAYARPGWQCRHNLNYWQFGDYLGVGAGAHGKLSFHDRIVRDARPKHPRDYMHLAGSAEANVETRTVGVAELPFEFMMNALRLTGGFDAELYRARTGQELFRLEPILRQAEMDGLIERTLHWLRPTEQGSRYLNDLLTRFLS